MKKTGNPTRPVNRVHTRTNRSLYVFIGLILIFMMNGFIATHTPFQKDNDVKKAFELRIDGNVEEAAALLNDIIEENPQNAMAHYELARTLNYMNLMGSEEATKLLITAKTIEPENVIYQFAYAKNCFFETYKAMQMGGSDVKELLDKTCDEFDNVLKIEPGYPEALMYLVEIYGILPAELGGDKTKAEKYTQQLEKADNFFGARARLIMMPEGTDMIGYWENYMEEQGESAEALKELGVAALFNDDIETAKVKFEKAINLDPAQNIRLLDLSRYHQMKVMQNRDLANEELPKANEYVDLYLSSVPEPIPPLKAYALGTKAKIEMFLGNNAKSEELAEQAKNLDPYYSRAFGIPWLSVFQLPTEEDHFFASFFSPF